MGFVAFPIKWVVSVSEWVVVAFATLAVPTAHGSTRAVSNRDIMTVSEWVMLRFL